MSSPIAGLYDARLRLFLATPGSKDWWRAIRDLRAARRRFQEILAGLARAARSLVDTFRDAMVSIVDAMPELEGARGGDD